MLKIDVDVRRLFALRRDEALEQKIDLGRVHIGDGEAIADGGVGGGAAPLAENAEASRVVHDVVDGEEIGRVVEFGDEDEFLLERLAHFLGDAIGETPGRALPGQLLQMRLRRLALRHRFVWIFVFQLVEREAAGVCDLDGACQRLFVAFEQARHFMRGFQMPLGIGFEAEARVRDRAFLTNASEHVLKGAAVGRVIEHAPRGDEGRSCARRKPSQRRDAGAVAAAIRMLCCEIEGRARRKRLFEAAELVFEWGVMPANGSGLWRAVVTGSPGQAGR